MSEKKNREKKICQEALDINSIAHSFNSVISIYEP